MRYRELIEQVPTKQALTINEAWDIMQSHCTNAVQVAFPSRGRRPQIAYRGTKNRSGPDIFLGASVSNRTPKDSSEQFQQIVDQALINYLGSDAAVRSNSIFVTSSLEQARMYGSKIYVIFPFDSAAITWSDSISDLVVENEIKSWTEFVPMSELPAYQKFLQLIEQNPEINQDKNLNQLNVFFQTRRDYMSWSELPTWKLMWINLPAEAHAAGNQSGLTEVLTKIGNLSWHRIRINYLYKIGLAKFNESKFIEQFAPQTGDWSQALFSENEIYVRGEYVAIEEEQFEKLIR